MAPHLKPFVLFFSFLLITSSLNAQGIEGKVLDPAGEAVPFATIYTSGTLYSTTSNADGQFKLGLPKGKHTLYFQSMGLKTVSREVRIQDDFLQLEIKMSEKVIMLQEVNVKAGKEDPAYPIMRKAIAMRSYYEKQVQAFEAKAYVKGAVKVHDFPSMYKMMMSKEDRKEMEEIVGKTHVVESIAEVNYEQPQKYEHKIIAVQSSMPNEETDGIPMVLSSLYHEYYLESILSPLAPSAMRHYRFSYQGYFEDGDRFVNKIKVTPRHKAGELFEGYIYIAEDYWNIHSTDLSFSIRFVENHMKQTYAEIEENVWLPVTHEIKSKANFMGVKADIQYVVSVKDYQVSLNPKLNHQLLAANETTPSEKEEEIAEPKKEEETKEEEEQILALLEKDKISARQARKLRRKIARQSKKAQRKESLEIKEEDGLSMEKDSLADQRTQEYWQDIRPVPLTPEQTDSYQHRDSLKLATIKKSDTVATNKGNRPPKNTFLKKGKKYLGGTLFGTKLNDKLKYTGLVNQLSFNTVDGWKPSTSLVYERNFSRKNDFKIEGRINYAVARNSWLPQVSLSRNYAPMKRGRFSIEAGRNSVDFNEKDGVSPALNTFSTLFLKWNLMKLYQKDYLTAQHQIDLANGLSLQNTVEFSRRNWLTNNDTLDIFNWERSFASNEIRSIEVDENNFPANEAFVFGAKLNYTPRHRYRIRKGAKYMARPTYPTFELAYRKAIGDGEQAVKYDFVSFKVRQEKDWTFLHNFEYQLMAGAFFNKENFTFADFHHFRNIQLPFYFGKAFGNFRLLDYYEQSTSERFFQANLALYSKRLFLKRLPLLNETYMKETLFANYLYTPEMGNYTEIGYALTEIFFFASAEVAAGFIDTDFQGVTFKVGLFFD